MNEKLKKAIEDGKGPVLKGKHKFRLWPGTHFNFGKYEGKTFWEVACDDPGYIRWARKTMPRFKKTYENNRDFLDFIMEKAERIALKNLWKKCIKK